MGNKNRKSRAKNGKFKSRLANIEVRKMAKFLFNKAEDAAKKIRK